MTIRTCRNCGFTGEIIHFKNGPRGRKIHDECSTCRQELTNLIDQRCQLFTYLMKYRNAFDALTLGTEIMNNFKKWDLTPSYEKGGQHLGSMQDTHFVPIAHLALEHAESDIKVGTDLRKEIEKVLGPIVSISPDIKIERKVWTRENLRSDIASYENIPTGRRGRGRRGRVLYLVFDNLKTKT